MTINHKQIPLRVAILALYLQDFNYKIDHRSGTQMKHADALSRVLFFFLSDSITNRLNEAQMKDERKNVQILFFFTTQLKQKEIIYSEIVYD